MFFSCSTQLIIKFILLINVKMPTVVGIFRDFILPILQPNTGCFQIKKGLYFPNFGDFFPNLKILLGFISKFKRHRLFTKKGNKITDFNIY